MDRGTHVVHCSALALVTCSMTVGHYLRVLTVVLPDLGLVFVAARSLIVITRRRSSPLPLALVAEGLYLLIASADNVGE